MGGTGAADGVVSKHTGCRAKEREQSAQLQGENLGELSYF